MRKNFYIFILLLFAIQYGYAATYTWKANANSTSWDTNNNWSPNGTPGATDDVIIQASTNIPTLTANKTVSNFTLSSGTINLGSFILTVTKKGTFQASGIITSNSTTSGTPAVTTYHGTVNVTGQCIDFPNLSPGATISANFTAVTDTVDFGFSTFNGIVNVTKTGAATDYTHGGNTFNNKVAINATGSGAISTSHFGGESDTYNARTTFTNTGTNSLVAGGFGTIFNKIVEFTCSSSGAGSVGAARFNDHSCTFQDSVYFTSTTNTSTLDVCWLLGSSTTFNGPVIVNALAGGIGLANLGTLNLNNNLEISSTGSVQFGSTTGTTSGKTTVNSGYTISIGSGGCSGTYFILDRVTQLGTTPFTLTLGGNAKLYYQNSTFNAPVYSVSPEIEVAYSTFNNTVHIEKNGDSYNTPIGGNTFNGVTELVNSCSVGGGGVFGIGRLAKDIFNQDLKLISTGPGYLGIAQGTNGTELNGDLYVNSTSTGVVQVGQATSTLAAGKKIIVGNLGFNSGRLRLYGLTQLGTTTPQAFTLPGTGSLVIAFNTTFNSTVNFVASNVSLNGGIFNNTTYIENGTNGTSNSNGGNVFNGITEIRHTGTSQLYMSITNPDYYNNTLTATFTNTGNMFFSQGGIGTQFNCNVLLNNLNGTSGGFYLGNSGGTSTMASGYSWQIGPLGFTNGLVSFRNHTQLGPSSQIMNFAGNTSMIVGPNCVFNGTINFKSPQLFLNGAIYNGVSHLEKTGANNNYCNGGNTFNNTATIANSSAAFYYLANNTADIFNGPTTFLSSGAGILYVSYARTDNQYNNDVTFSCTGSGFQNRVDVNSMTTSASTFNGNIYVNCTNTDTQAGVFFGAGGPSTLVSGKTISVGSTGFVGGSLTIRKFTQVGTTPQALTLTGTATLTINTCTFEGDFTAITNSTANISNSTFQRSFNLVTSSIVMTSCSTNTVSGTTVIEKNGGTNDQGNGGNYFGGATTITHNESVTNSSSTGSIIMDQWTGVGGTSISDIPVNTTPNNITTLSSFEIPSNTADNYGVRVKGYINAPQTGNYTFWIAGDDNVELWLSTDATEGNKVRIAYHTSWTNSQEWTKLGTQQSSAISLVAGQRYYIEALMKEGGGGDNLAVGWQLPDATLERPIPGNRLSPVTTTLVGSLYFGVSSRDVFASSATFNENTNNILSVAHNSNGNTFGGTTTFNVINSGTIRVATLSPATSTFNGSSVFNSSNTSSIRVAEGSGTTATFNGNMSFTNTSTLGIYFGNAGSGGNTTLANTYALSNSTFNDGNLSISNFTQTGSGANQLLALTGTATLTLGPSVTFNALVDFDSPQVYLNGGIYNGTTSIEKTGATDNSSNGNNTFNGTTTITNNGTGFMRLAGVSPDNFVGNVTYDGLGTGALQPAYNGQNNFDGNITCNRALVWNGGTGVTYCRNGNIQLISGTTLQTIPRLTIDKTANYLALGFNLTVSSALTLTQGYLDLNGYELTISNAATTAITRTSGWVRSERTDNTSKITWQMGSTTGAHIFPFGKNSSTYIPFTFDLSSGSIGDITLATYPTATDNTPYPVTPEAVASSAYSSLTDNQQNMVDRYWQINKTGTGTADITFTYADDEIPAGGEAGLVAQRYSGLYSKWMQNVSTQSQNTAANTVTVVGVTTFSPWTLILPASPLSVKFVAFEANGMEGKIGLNWEITSPEASPKSYFIERSNDGKGFIIIGQIENSTAKNFSYSDNAPIHGVNYYRIKAEEANGEYTYSTIRAVKAEQKATIVKTYPNPTSDGNLNISISTSSGEYDSDITISVMDMLGKEVYSKVVKASSINEIINLNLEGIISKGIYRIVVSVGTINASELIVIQ